jgi:hypothetical protein
MRGDSNECAGIDKGRGPVGFPPIGQACDLPAERSWAVNRTGHHVYALPEPRGLRSEASMVKTAQAISRIRRSAI